MYLCHCSCPYVSTQRKMLVLSMAHLLVASRPDRLASRGKMLMFLHVASHLSDILQNPWRLLGHTVWWKTQGCPDSSYVFRAECLYTQRTSQGVIWSSAPSQSVSQCGESYYHQAGCSTDWQGKLNLLYPFPGILGHSLLFSSFVIGTTATM